MKGESWISVIRLNEYMNIISQNGLIRVKLDHIGRDDSNAADNVFRYGSDIMGVYYDLDHKPKMCVLATYTCADLAITSFDDFIDWRDNYSSKEPEYQFMSQEECIAVDEHLTEYFDEMIHNTYERNNS